MSSEQFVQYLVDGITNGSIYALIGLGFTIIYAVTNIINFAQGEFVMLGGMVSYMMVRSLGIPTLPTAIIAVLVAIAIFVAAYHLVSRPARICSAVVLLLLVGGSIPLTLYLFREFAGAKIPVGAATLLSLLVVAGVGAGLYILAIRPARRASTVSLIIITIGAAILLRGLAAELWGVDAVRTTAFTGTKSIEILGAYVHPQALWMVGITVLLTILVYLFFSFTVMGKALKACAISPGAAGLVGIDAKRMALVAFTMAAALGGICGAVMAPKTFMSYQDGFTLGLYGFVAAAFAGFRSPLGAVAGGFALGIIISLVVGIDWGPFTSQYKDVVAMTLFLLILVLRSSRLAAEERPS